MDNATTDDDDFLEDGEELGDVHEQTLNAIRRLHSHLGSGLDSNRRLSREYVV